MKEPNFEFYVLNYDWNAKKVINFNVFQNVRVYDWTLSAVKKHLRNKKKFTRDDLKEEIRSSLMNQEWARREYEISVADAFEDDIEKLEKWDCFAQAEPNLDVITDMVISRYKKYLKEKDSN